VSDCCLKPGEQYFSYIMAGKSYISIFDEMMYALYKSNTLSWIFIVLDVAHLNSSPQVDMSLCTRTHYADSEPTNLCFLLNVQCLAGLTRMWPEPTIHPEQTNNYNTNVTVFNLM